MDGSIVWELGRHAIVHACPPLLPVLATIHGGGVNNKSWRKYRQPGWGRPDSRRRRWWRIGRPWSHIGNVSTPYKYLLPVYRFIPQLTYNKLSSAFSHIFSPQSPVHDLLNFASCFFLLLVLEIPCPLYLRELNAERWQWDTLQCAATRWGQGRQRQGAGKWRRP